MITDYLCKAFRVHGTTTFRCCLLADHPQARHEGPGSQLITWAAGPAPRGTWYDSDPGAQGVFRRPDDSSGKTPFDGEQVIPGDSIAQ